MRLANYQASMHPHQVVEQPKTENEHMESSTERKHPREESFSIRDSRVDHQGVHEYQLNDGKARELQKDSFWS
jgi:hypothetical protein